jgi:hypothetical protein
VKRREAISMLLGVLLCTSLIGAQEAKSQKVAAKAVVEPAPIAKTFPFDRGRVFRALLGAVSAQDLFPQEMDERAGTMLLHQQAVETMSFGDANRAVAKLTTKKVGSLSTWQMLNVTGTIDCREVEAGKTEVKIAFRFEGNNVASSNWEKLISSGVLEEKILSALDLRLNDARPKK